jgi:hypothetical protein
VLVEGVGGRLLYLLPLLHLLPLLCPLHSQSPSSSSPLSMAHPLLPLVGGAAVAGLTQLLLLCPLQGGLALPATKPPAPVGLAQSATRSPAPAPSSLVAA